MSSFKIQNAFKNCLLPLDNANSHKENDGFFIRKFEKDCCAWDRGFFLQLYLVECDFSKNMMDPSEVSHLALTVPDVDQEIRKLDGSVTFLPVINFTIYLNREIFNKVIDDAMPAFRARCVAHELLFVEKYANGLGIELGIPMLPSVPHPDGREEDAVLCCWVQIENFLKHVEAVHGVKIETNVDFMAILPTAAGTNYCKMWLDNCVDKLTCIERTSMYLLWAERADLDSRMMAIVQKLAAAFQFSTLSKNELRFKIKKSDAFYRNLIAEYRSVIGLPVEEFYIFSLAGRVIDTHWEPENTSI